MPARRTNVTLSTGPASRGVVDLDSRIAIFGHPIHAMLVAFPIAGVFWVAGCDAAYWWTLDPFFARAALWGSGAAFVMGSAASLSGLGELLAVPGARRHTAGWSHGVIAMTLLAVLALNWAHRMNGYEDAVLPWGALLSGLQIVLVVFTGWHGGRLVFEHGFAVELPEDTREERAGGGTVTREP